MKDKIRYGNSSIVYTITKSKRRKTSEIIVDDSGVEVRTPITKKDSEIKQLVDSRKEWIFQKQLQFRDRKIKQDKNLYKNKLPYFGKDIALKVKTNQRTEKIEHSKNQFTVYLMSSYSKNKVLQLYEKWLLKKAHIYLENRIERLSQKIGIKPSKVIIKSLKSIWGSATSEGVINLNSKLLKSPKKAIDYIIIHELCHLKIGPHSKSFWNLVEKYCPGYKTQKNWLDDNSIKIL